MDGQCKIYRPSFLVPHRLPLLFMCFFASSSSCCCLDGPCRDFLAPLRLLKSTIIYDGGFFPSSSLSFHFQQRRPPLTTSQQLWPKVEFGEPTKLQAVHQLRHHHLTLPLSHQLCFNSAQPLNGSLPLASPLLPIGRPPL